MVCRLLLPAVAVWLGGAPADAQDRGWREPPAPHEIDEDAPPPPDRGYRRDYDDGRGDVRRGPDDRDWDRGADDAGVRRRGGYRDDGYGDADDEGREAGAVDAPDTRVFRDDLDRWGRWEDDPEHGSVWVPEDVGDEWRPYTRGQWTYTADYGWYWVSDEPWGWATYHYGRWGYDARRHWFWVPDTKWGPAWVAWRGNDDYLGWAPLPPPTRSGRDADRLEGPRFGHYWIFVRPRFFGMAGLGRYVQPPYVTDHILSRTRPAGGIVVEAGRVVNRGLPIEDVQRLTGRTPRTFRPVFSGRHDDRRALRPGLGTVQIYAPRWGVPARGTAGEGERGQSGVAPATGASGAGRPAAPAGDAPPAAMRPAQAPAATGTPSAASPPPKRGDGRRRDAEPAAVSPPSIAAPSAPAARPVTPTPVPAKPPAAAATAPVTIPAPATSPAASTPATSATAAAPTAPVAAQPTATAPVSPAVSPAAGATAVGSPAAPRIINHIAAPAAAPASGQPKPKREPSKDRERPQPQPEAAPTSPAR